MARRVAAFVATLVFLSALVFVVVRVLPGDPAALILGVESNPETVARLRQALGLDRPLAVQYVDWLARAARGDLGTSIQYDVPVGRLILSRLPVTLPLALMAAAIMIAVALPLGVYAAMRHRRAGDYAAMLVSQLGIAVPAFWSGLLLILLFSVRLGWFRSGGFDGWSAGVVAGVKALLLPAIVTVMGIQLGQLIAGAIVLESVFALPGLGRLALVAIGARDLPVVQGVTLFVAASIVFINFAVDLAYAALDPRIRYE